MLPMPPAAGGSEKPAPRDVPGAPPNFGTAARPECGCAAIGSAGSPASTGKAPRPRPRPRPLEGGTPLPPRPASNAPRPTAERAAAGRAITVDDFPRPPPSLGAAGARAVATAKALAAVAAAALKTAAFARHVFGGMAGGHDRGLCLWLLAVM